MIVLLLMSLILSKSLINTIEHFTGFTKNELKKSLNEKERIVPVEEGKAGSRIDPRLENRRFTSAESARLGTREGH